MNPLELLPTTQQAALRAAAAGRLTFRNSSAGYVATSDGSQHPVRTVRALNRAGLVELVRGRGQRAGEDGGSIVTSTCDDRFLAALYCAAHYDGTDSTEAIDVIAAVADGRAAAVLKTDPTRYLRASA